MQGYVNRTMKNNYMRCTIICITGYLQCIQIEKSERGERVGMHGEGRRSKKCGRIAKMNHLKNKPRC
jgi:hypothetical protein